MIYNLIPRFINNQYQQQNYAGHFYAHTMFMDISGFTPLTESLMKQGKVGAEILSSLVNQVFEPVIETVYNHGGFISTFAGDAFTAIFPTTSPQITHKSILQVAVTIQHIFKQSGLKHTQVGDFQLDVKIGLGIGEINWGIVGTPNHKAFLFSGQGIIDCAQAESMCKQGEIVLSKAFQEATPTLVKQNRFQWQTEQPSPIKNNVAFSHLENISLEIATKFYPKRILTTKTSGEFREVVSVFISFQGVDTLAELDKFVSTVITHLDRFGGYFARSDFGDKGNTILIFFGCPIAYENNVERAFNFILTLKNDDALLEDLADLSWRAGITAGTMYAGIVGIPQRCEYTVLGTSVNLSARLMMKANWGELLIPETLANHPHFTIEYKGNFHFKGVEKSIATYNLLAQNLVYKQFHNNLMVGRESELKQLHTLAKPIFNKQFGGITYVYGEAGMGKSRLVFEFNQSLKNVIWFTCNTESILQQPFNPFIYTLKKYFNLKDSLPLTERKANFEKKYQDLLTRLYAIEDSTMLQDIIKEMIRTQSIIGALLGLHWDKSLYEVLEAKHRYENILSALKNFFLAHTLIKPVIIELEDIHWLDVESVYFLELLTQNIKEYPLFIVATSRYKDDGSKPTLFENEPSSFPVHSINLNQLSNNNLRQLADHELQGKISNQLFELLLDKTQANPFFTQQILQYLKEKNLLNWQGNCWYLTTNTIKIPSSLNTLLIARLDRLSIDLKEIVQIAAVIGREFDVDVLSRVSEQIVFKQIEMGIQKQIWLPIAAFQYIFKHALLQNAAYEMQLKTRLKNLHYLVAQATETLYAHNLKEKYADIAFHYEQADKPKQAIHWYKNAAKHATETYANTKAITYYNKILTLIENLSLTKAKNLQLTKLSAYQSLGQVLSWLGNHNQALTQYITAYAMLNTKAIQANISLDTQVSYRVELSCQIAQTYLNYSDYNKALEWLDKGHDDSFLNQNKVPPELAQIYITRAIFYNGQGEYNKAIYWSEKGMTILRQSKTEASQKMIGWAYNLLGFAYVELGNYNQALSFFQNAVQAYKQVNNLIGLSGTYINLGFCYFFLGKWDQAFQTYQQSLTISETTGNISVQATVIHNLGDIHFGCGRWSQAIEAYQESFTIWQKLEGLSQSIVALNDLAQVYLAQNKYHKAQSALEYSETLSATIDSNAHLPDLTRCWAILYLKTNKLNQALSFINRSIASADELKQPLKKGLALRVLGEIQLANNKNTSVKQTLEESWQILSDLGSNYEIAKTELILAKWAIKTASLKQAKQYLSQATHTFKTLGAKADLVEAEQLATQLKTLPFE